MDSTNLLPPADGLRVRASAVAKLKRAASLPRMKDGRRPPMHGEAVSEGERATPSPVATPNLTDESREGSPLLSHEPLSETREASWVPQQTQPNFTGDDEEDDPATPQAHLGHSQSHSQSQQHEQSDQPEESSYDTSGVSYQDFEQDQDQEQDGARNNEDEPESAQSRTTTPTTSQRRKKRRSRSRSRSRSKDLKEVMANLSRSEDEGSTAPPPVPPSPFLQGVQPPTGFGTPILQAAWPYVPPQSPHFFAATPTSPSPLPSLDAIRAGLIRSNSAAGRMMAFHKLTGGKESPEPMRLSPSPSPAPPITRSNTVTGGERMAARNMMLRRLGERRKEADGDRIAEEPPSAPEAPQILKRRPGTADALTRASPAGSFDFLPHVKRSPQPSIITSVVDDREASEVSPSSPAPRSRPLLIPESESSTSTPVPEHSAGYQSSGRPDTSLSNSSAFGYSRRTTDGSRMGDQEPFEYDGAEVRDGVVIERDELEGGSARNAIPPHFGSPARSSPSTSQRGLPGRFSPAQQPPQRPPTTSHPSDTSSMLSASNAEPIPLFISTQGERSPYKQDTFPVEFSPFGTPNKESIITESEEEGDDVIYPEDAKARKAWFEKVERDGPRAWTGSPLMCK